MSSAERKGGGLVRKVQETSGGLEQLPLGGIRNQLGDE